MFQTSLFEPPHDKTNTMACAPSEDSDQPGHPPSLTRVFAVRSMGSKSYQSLIRVFDVRMKTHWVPYYPLSALRRLWSDWADAQADLNLRWAHRHFVGFVVRRLICRFSPIHAWASFAVHCNCHCSPTFCLS